MNHKKFHSLLLLLVLASLLMGLFPAPGRVLAQAEAPASPGDTSALAYNSLALSGTDGYVRVPNSAELNNLSALTIEAWVYRANTNRNETLVGNGWTTSYWLGFSGTGKLRFITHGGDVVDSASTVAAEKWVHVAVTYDGSRRNFYINGVLDRTTTDFAGAIVGNPTDPLGIGFDADPFTSNYFSGMIDEVRMWNVARSQADIRAGMFQAYTSDYPAELIGYWKLDGNANDATGDHNGSLQGGLGSSAWANAGGLPRDIRIPQVSSTPTLDGLCSPAEYSSAVVVSVDGVQISLQHTATDLWVCFDFYLNGSYTRASLLLDPNHDRLTPPQPDDLRLDVHDDDSLAAYAGNDAGQWVSTPAFDGQWDGEWHVSGTEFPLYTAEFRVGQALTGGWGKVIGLALDPYIPGYLGFDLAGIWPALASNIIPVTWSSATLAGTGPARTFSGSVQYQPKDASLPASGVPGARVELYGSDPGGSEALVAATTSGLNGSFSLTTDDDFSQHRLELAEYPQGYLSAAAAAPTPGSVLDARTIDYGSAGGGSYPGNVFTLGDVIPQNFSAPYGPVFLILAPQQVVDSGALDAFRTFKLQQGYAVSIRSVEEADAYPGATRLEKIRALEQDYLAQYGSRFQFVMLVGGDAVIPFAKITPYATGEGAVCPTEEPINYKYSDWLYVDLTSNFDNNGNGCYADGALQNPANLASGYTRDTGIAFDPTVALGRLPFSNPDTIRRVLQNSIGFESQTESYKLKALNGMSLVALKGYFDGAPCTNDSWGYHCVPPVPNTQTNYDTALLSEEMQNDFLDVNGFATTFLYENEESVAGGQGIASPVDLTEFGIRSALDDSRFGLATMTGHGNATGVYRNYWKSDKNLNGVVDVSDGSLNELAETAFFSISSVLNQTDPENSRGSVFVLLACSNATPTSAGNLAATILADGHGPASVAALSVVTVGNWFDEGDGNVESIGYYVNKRLVGNSYRLGEALWWTMADLLRDGNSGSGGVAYDLYGDPTLSFYGNPSGQASLAAWPMGRRDAAGNSYLGLPGPASPKPLWEYTAGAHAADTPGPTPLVGNENEVIVASGQYVDILRQGALYQRLTLDASVFGSPALSADGTLYVLDQNADLYAFARQRAPLGGQTIVLDSRSRRWKVDLGENPQASPVVGADGFLLAGVGGPTASDPRLWLVRPDGLIFSSFALDHNPIYYAATDASRTIYVTTGRVGAGHLYRFSQFCDESVTPDVCPAPFWDELSINAAFNTPPLLAYGALYAGDVNGKLYKINSETLAIEASFNADSAIQLGPIASPNGDVLFISSQGVMYSLTKNLGIVRWQKNLGSTSVGSIPAAASNAIYLAFSGYLRAYNPSSGAQLWKRSLGEEIGYASVAVGYGREVFVQGVDGSVLAFGEGWGIRPARITALPGVTSGTRHYMNIEILQSLPPMSSASQAAPTADVVAILLQRSENGGPWEDLAWLAPGTASYTDNNVEPDSSYAYRAQNLMNDGSNSDFTATLEVIQSLPDAPAAPVLTGVTALSAEAIELTWEAAAGSVVASFRVERGPAAGGPFTALATLTGESVALLDSGLAPGTGYFYRVVAINPSGESSPSNVIGATTKAQTLAAPENLATSLDADLKINLTWAAGPAGATAVIEMNAFGESTFSAAGSAPADGSFSLFGGEPNAYTFRVKFVQGDTESPWAYSQSVVIEAAPAMNMIYLPLALR